MIAHLPMGAIATDQNNMVLEVNDEFCRMFQLGTKAADLLGTNSQDFLQELYGKAADPEKFSRDGRETVDQKKKVLDYEIILKDGRVIERDYLPIFDEDRFLGQLFLYNDVTRERRIDAAKSEFMSLASHQLRTPLTTIRWALGRLQKSEDSLDESQKRMLDAAKGASVLMAETINAMLTISRIEARQITIQAEDIDVHQLVETIRRDVQREYEPKNQSFSIHVQGSSLVRSDENLLKEIVTNLIRNAIKYTKEEGKIDVYICGTQASVSIQVVDNGLGIPLHQQNRVFQKFFRADNAISREPDGTGLGLYLVSITIKLLGGSIEFESEEDKGTTFTITLPVSPPHPS
jgi:two-component system phosphate regulon sensor histidine kinase PhoR